MRSRVVVIASALLACGPGLESADTDTGSGSGTGDAGETTSADATTSTSDATATTSATDTATGDGDGDGDGGAPTGIDPCVEPLAPQWAAPRREPCGTLGFHCDYVGLEGCADGEVCADELVWTSPPTAYCGESPPIPESCPSGSLLIPLPDSTTALHLAVGNVDADPEPELLALRPGGAVDVLDLTGSTTVATVPGAPTSGRLTTGDFDGDGDTDVVALDEQALAVWFIGRGPTGFEAPAPIPLPGCQSGACLARDVDLWDVDGDDQVELTLGWSDVTASYYCAQNGGTLAMEWAELDWTPLWGLEVVEPHPTPDQGTVPVFPPAASCTGPYDCDLRPAVTDDFRAVLPRRGGVTPARDACGNTIVVGIGSERPWHAGTLRTYGLDGAEVYPRAAVVLEAPNSTQDYYDTTAADLDGDGVDELVSANSRGLFVFRRTGTYDFEGCGDWLSTAAGAPALGERSELESLDVDGDGDVDLAVLDASGVPVLLRNDA